MNAFCPNSEQLYWPRPTFSRKPPSLNLREFSHTVLGLRLKSRMKSAKLNVWFSSSTRCCIILRRVSCDKASNILDSCSKLSSAFLNSFSSSSRGQSARERGTSSMVLPSRTSRSSSLNSCRLQLLLLGNYQMVIYKRAHRRNDTKKGVAPAISSCRTL